MFPTPLGLFDELTTFPCAAAFTAGCLGPPASPRAPPRACASCCHWLVAGSSCGSRHPRQSRGWVSFPPALAALLRARWLRLAFAAIAATGCTKGRPAARCHICACICAHTRRLHWEVQPGRAAGAAGGGLARGRCHVPAPRCAAGAGSSGHTQLSVSG